MLQNKCQCPPVKGGVGFREGQGFADKTRQPLTQGVVPTLLVGSLAALFAHATVLLRRQDGLISAPAIAACGAGGVFKRHTLPELLASACLVRADEKGDDLARPTAQRRPQPTFTCRFVTHKRPHLIQLQYIVCLHRQQRLDQQWHLHRLLYQPTAHRLAMNPKHALKPAQTDALCTSPQNRRFLLWRIACFRLQHPIHATVFTMELRIATFIRTIFDYICTATGTTGIGDELSYHVADFG